MKAPEHYQVSAPVLDQIVSYLTSRPWQEVQGLLQALGNETQPQVEAANVPEPEADPVPVKEKRK